MNQALKILLIEDDEDDFLLTRDLLEEIDDFRCQVEWVATYEAGLEQIRLAQHDLYLVDYHLGLGTGLDLLREAPAAACPSPVILLTGSGNREIDVAAAKAGAMDYLVKGEITPALLERSLRYAHKSKRAEAQLRAARDELELRVQERTRDLTRTNESLQSEIAERGRIEAHLRMARDEAERASRAKSEFLSRTSHELRTPLNSILGFGQLLQMTQPPGKDREEIDLIVSAGRHLLDLINEVLDIARAESGRLSLSLEPVNLNDVLGESIALARPLAAQHGIDIHSDLSAEPCFILADQQRFKQVLLNLFSNAVKYNHPHGHIRVACDIAPAQNHSDDVPAAPTVNVTISNTGRGIAPEKMHRLFTPFDRLDAERAARPVEGVGLGLALSKSIVESMHGHIEASSQVAGETRFSVALPLTSAPAAHPINVAAAATSPHKPQILYIEDNAANLILVETMLETLGWPAPFTATRGSAALELARQNRPQLILLDLHLPDINGDAVLEILKADAILASIPVIMLSADAMPQQSARLIALGAAAYLTKPFDVQKLLRVVAKVLDAAPPAP